MDEADEVEEDEVEEYFARICSSPTLPIRCCHRQTPDDLANC